MLFPGPMCGYAFAYDNWGTPSATPGTSVTPGASNVEGSWTQVASSANIAQDCYWVHISISGGATATTAKNQLLDIGIDPAGGTAYVAFLSNLVMGETSTKTGVGLTEFVFPIFIKAGSSVAVRIQGSAATAGTVRVAARFFGQPTNPEACPTGAVAQTFGTITNSSGASFTPGNAVNGAWVDLGALTTPLWWWQLGWQIDNTVITAEFTTIEVAYGDASNKHIILKEMHSGTTGETATPMTLSRLTACSAYRPVPAGQNIYIRGICNNAPDTGYNATVIGIGG